PWHKWLAWDGTRWRPDDAARATRLAKETIVDLFAEASAIVNAIKAALQGAVDTGALSAPDGTLKSPDTLKEELKVATALMKWCLISEAAPRINAMLDLARSEPDIPILPADMDQDPWLLNCPNGTLDLRTGRLRQHRRTDFLTQLCPTAFDPEALCPT